VPVDGAGGLSSAEAAGLLERFGPNEIPEERRSLLLEIGLRFWGPIPWMIEAAVVLTAVMGRWACGVQEPGRASRGEAVLVDQPAEPAARR
jgi:magnesium-transporting ATPase (P-type)